LKQRKKREQSQIGNERKKGTTTTTPVRISPNKGKEKTEPFAEQKEAGKVVSLFFTSDLCRSRPLETFLEISKLTIERRKENRF
jgi:hypothetical protein